MRFKHSATTLVEITLYFALLGVFLMLAMSFSIQIIQLSELTARSHEIQTQMTMVQERIKTSLLSAESIELVGSVFDSDNGVLRLNFTDPVLDPTQIMLSDGQIFIQEGAGLATALHSSAIEVTQFRIHRTTYDKTPDQVQIDILATMPSDVVNLDVSKTYHFTLSLRP